tara:strand:- start:408 stop:608 length:201 start_codon:yes stop_codon:yes gene_type:complete
MTHAPNNMVNAAIPTNIIYLHFSFIRMGIESKQLIPIRMVSGNIIVVKNINPNFHPVFFGAYPNSL